MNLKANKRIPESAIYIIVWLVIFIIPVLVTTSNTGEFRKIIFVEWLRMVPFVLIFIINSVWLLPELLFKGKTAMYLLSVVLLSLFLVYVWDFVFPFFLDFIYGGNVPNNTGFFPEGQRPRLPRPRQRLITPDQPIRPPRGHLLSIFNQMIVAWLVVGFNTAIKITNKWFKDEQKKRELEKEHLKSELAFLQNQISPHFFMNTLNNIHAQIDIDSKEAQSSIVTLSKMMRYLLYESDRGLTTLKKEIEFLQSYIQLMKLRVDEQVDISLNLEISDSDVNIHPFLFISFIENAFKHGISYNERSFIKVNLVQTETHIEFYCQNSVSVQNKITSPYSGVGLENIKKRLKLLYGNRFNLKIDEEDATYKVHLIIPANED